MGIRVKEQELLQHLTIRNKQIKFYRLLIGSLIDKMNGFEDLKGRINQKVVTSNGRPDESTLKALAHEFLGNAKILE